MSTQTKQERLKLIIEEMMESLPTTVQMMVKTFGQSYLAMMDSNIDEETIDILLEKVEEKIAYIRYGDDVNE